LDLDYDVIIIGGGVTGCCIARTLSRYDLKVCLLEKDADIASGTTKANSGIVHAGYAAERKYKKRDYCIRGNALFDQAHQELNFPFKRCGTFVVALEENQIRDLVFKRNDGLEDGVPGLEIIIDKERIKAMEPNLTDDVVAVLHAPSGGIVSPYELTFALAENALTNGVQFFRGHEVVEISQVVGGFNIKTKPKTFSGRIIINAAGLYAADVSRLAGVDTFEIYPRKGEYILFDKGLLNLNKVLFPMPTRLSKGILVSPTIHGHVFIGPNADNILDLEDISTTTRGLKEIIAGGRKLVPNLPIRGAIRNFAGLRAVSNTMDFIIEATDMWGFVNVGGILSPGLTSTFAIAEDVVKILIEDLGEELKEKEDYNPNRPKPEHLADFTKDQLDAKIKQDPAWSRIICRCETIPEAEIIDSIRRPVGATTVDGVKFRCRAGMGRCQGGFCLPRVMEILSKELNIPYEDVTKRGEGTYLLTKKVMCMDLTESVKEAEEVPTK
jgi:glycerol-3-phosphate dehydrogenase